jgi:hypothetical protein
VRHAHDRDRGAWVWWWRGQVADDRTLGDHDVVGEDDRKGFVANQLTGHQDGMAEAELLLLAHVADLGQVADVTHAPEHLDVAT